MTKQTPHSNSSDNSSDSLLAHEIYRGVYVIQICAFDRQQALDILKERYKDDTEFPNLRITRSLSKPMGNGECIYTFFFRLDKITNRPNCSECNSTHVISRGKEWYCRNCGKYWSKIKRNRNT